MGVPSIQQALAAVLERGGWVFEHLDDASARLEVTGDAGTWPCVLQANDERHYVVCYSLVPEPVPVDQRAVAAAFVCGANDGLLIGNFELLVDEGTMRFKTSIDVTALAEADLLTPAITVIMVRQVLHTNLLTFDRYLPAVNALLGGGSSPEAALTAIEGGLRRARPDTLR